MHVYNHRMKSVSTLQRMKMEGWAASEVTTLSNMLDKTLGMSYIYIESGISKSICNT